MIIITKPSKANKKQLKEVVNLIIKGKQVNSDGLQDRILRSELVAYKIFEGKVICTATLKNPQIAYRKKVFTSAKASSGEKYDKELGYIVTHPDFEGCGHCQDLLKEFFVKISSFPIYATTRKPAIIHILHKLGFRVAGEKYNNDLSLLIYEGL